MFVVKTLGFSNPPECHEAPTKHIYIYIYICTCICVYCTCTGFWEEVLPLPECFFCVAAQIVTFVATKRCQPPTIARKMICGSPCPALTHHPPGNVCYCFVLGPWVCGDAQTFHVRPWPRPVLACVCVHTQTFGTSQHIKLSKSIYQSLQRRPWLIVIFWRVA